MLRSFARLFERFPALYAEEHFSFARHTTIGCGGEAAYAVYPSCAEEAAALLGCLEKEKIPFVLLGAGANVLPQDGFFEGIVVRFRLLDRLAAEGDEILAGAGTTGGALCRFARQNRLTGFEPFTGIPMTVGGGIAMNAGVSEGHFSDVVRFVVGAEHGKLRVFPLRDCGFGEKESVFQEGIAVLYALLRGDLSDDEKIMERTARFRKKREHLPSGRSMGCVFVNPKGLSAGKLIEECGLKGVRVGGARVSEAHANFILNEGGSAGDISALVRLVRETVLKERGIALREEIRRIPY